MVMKTLQDVYMIFHKTKIHRYLQWMSRHRSKLIW